MDEIFCYTTYLHENALVHISADNGYTALCGRFVKMTSPKTKGKYICESCMIKSDEIANDDERVRQVGRRFVAEI